MCKYLIESVALRPLVNIFNLSDCIILFIFSSSINQNPEHGAMDFEFVKLFNQ